jgi:ribonuclease BN (tRNA processing enzyme)
LPFFIPIFIPGNKIYLYAGLDPISNEGPERIVGVQMQYSFFPVSEAEMKSPIECIVAMPHEPIIIGHSTVTPVMLNHPVINLGYRVECNGKSVFFTGDHEPHFNIYEADDAGHAEYQKLIEEQRLSIVEQIRGVDVVIADASYTQEEYKSKKGWGHGTYDTCIQLALDAGAKVLYCTHHEPTRCDDALEKVFAEIQNRFAGKLGELEIRLAREGEEFIL